MENQFFYNSGILFLTNNCNNNCLICQDKSPNLSKKLDMEYSQAVKLIDIWKKNQKKEIEIYGGEPLLCKDFWKILDYMIESGIFPKIMSNARVFSNTSIVSKIKVYNPKIITSIFSLDPDIHDTITTVPGSLEQSIAGINNLIKEGLSVVVTIVITKLNQNTILYIVNGLIEMGVDTIKISGLIRQGRMFEEKRSFLIPDFDKVKISMDPLVSVLEKNRKNSNNFSYQFEKLPLCLHDSLRLSLRCEDTHKEKLLIKPKNEDCCKRCKKRKFCLAVL